MRKKILWSLGLCCLVGLGAPARGDVCHNEVVPAATLLLPYFEVDLNDPTGASTLFAITNAFGTPVLVKAEVWSDLGVPVFGFNIYLNGYDVQTVALHDILVSGLLPPTAPPAGTFTSCAGVLPPATIPASTVLGYQHALTGQSSTTFGGSCAGRNLGDAVARGFITFDTVSVCSTADPGTPGYFGAGGTGIATNQNALWGDYFTLNATTKLNVSHTLAHIVASSTDPATSTAGRYTFYGRFVGWSAADNRQPLATNFGSRYFNFSPLALSADFLVWRDPKVAQGAFPCGGSPAWYPLAQQHVVALDESSNFTGVAGTPFPAVAQRVRVGSAALPVPYTFGWIYVDLNGTVAAAGSNPPVDPAAEQAWVAVMLNETGEYAVGHDAMRYDSACSARHVLP